MGVVAKISARIVRDYIKLPPPTFNIFLRLWCALVRECFKDDTVRKYIIRKVGSMAHNEIVTLCSDKINSTLLNPHPDMLSCFSWEELYLEISNHCPILTQVMKSGTSTRQPRTNQKAIICLCMAIMCNNRRTSMSLVQQIISVLLYTGHTSKEVSLSILVTIDINTSC